MTAARKHPAENQPVRNHFTRVRAALALGALLLPLGVLTAPANASPSPPPPDQPSRWSAVLPSGQHGIRSLHQLPGAALRQRAASYPRRLAAGSTSRRTPTVPTASNVTFDSTTYTLYVTSELANTVAVVDARSCNARRTHCHAPVATMRAFPTGAAALLDGDHRTLYVAADAAGVVAALDLRHCTARDTAGCSAAPNTVPVGQAPVGLTLNRSTHSLYVGSGASPMAVVDTATCNGHTDTGCAAPVATIGGPGVRLFPAVDPITETLYAPVAPDSGDLGIEIWDVSACRSGVTSGCSAAPVSFAPIDTFSLFVLLDRQSSTLFTGNPDDNSLSLIDIRTCNARDAQSCGKPHVKAPTQFGPEAAVIDPATRTLFVMNSLFDQAAAIDLNDCTISTPTQCPKRPRTLQTIAHPYGLEIDPATETLYLPSPVENTFQIFDAHSCNAQRTAGCRHEAPTAAGQVTELDPTHHTAYQLFDQQPKLGLLDTSRCNATTRSSCTGVTRLPLGQMPGDAALDRATHTLYVVDWQTNDLILLDTDRCNTSRHDGCSPFATLRLSEPGKPSLNPRTHAVYIASYLGSISVIDGAHCNALDRSACGESPLRVQVGGSPNASWVDPTTNTVYVTDIDDDDVFLLDGAACEARTTSCRKIAQTTVGSHPAGLTGNVAAHTLYVANFAYTDQPGSLSLVDTRHCQAADTTACDSRWPSAPAGHGTFGVRYDSTTNTVFTANLQGTVSIIPAQRCTTRYQDGCPARPWRIAVGTAAVGAYIDDRAHTLYVVNPRTGEGTAIIDTRHPCRSAVCFR